MTNSTLSTTYAVAAKYVCGFPDYMTAYIITRTVVLLTLSKIEPLTLSNLPLCVTYFSLHVSHLMGVRFRNTNRINCELFCGSSFRGFTLVRSLFKLLFALCLNSSCLSSLNYNRFAILPHKKTKWIEIEIYANLKSHLVNTTTLHHDLILLWFWNDDFSFFIFYFNFVLSANVKSFNFYILVRS